MSDQITEIINRCRKLGLACDNMPTDEANSALAALACFPMYMVANVDAWTSDHQFRVPLLDLPGSEHIREAFVLGKQEAKLDIEKAHRRVLSAMVSNARASDLIVYEYALETLQTAMGLVSAELAEGMRLGIARMIVAVAKASGEGIGGSGPKVSPQELACIQQIDQTLSLSSSAAAAKVLAEVIS